MRLLKESGEYRSRVWLPHLVIDPNFEEFRDLLTRTKDRLWNELFLIDGTKLYKHIGALEMLKELLEYTDRNNVSFTGGKE